VTDYSSFALFYDRIMGDRSDEVARVQAQVSRHRPQAKSLLELGCGTGAILAGVAGDFAATGLDRSAEMLSIAAERVPEARLIRADMTTFSMPDRFDVVICVFDTLNHLPAFGQWMALFDRAHEHLDDGGLFIFDVNTAGRLRRLQGAPPYLDEFDGNVVLMTVRSAGGRLSLWETRIFERRPDDLFRLHHERIYELGVPLQQIRTALADQFDLLEQSSLDGSPVSDESDRIFFVFRRRTRDT
jgi:SAM-dependent methyltransferase